MAVDPDAEVICAAEVSPAATGDAAVAPGLLGDLVEGEGGQAAQVVVYGDSAYGTGTNSRRNRAGFATGDVLGGTTEE